MKQILKKYGIEGAQLLIKPHTNGLINKTWKVVDGEEKYILQRINDHVFKHPGQIAKNISMIARYLEQTAPSYLFPSPLKTINGEELVRDETTGWYRLFPFVNGSHTIDVVLSADQAFEAASQFGRFTRLLSGFDATKLYITIPDFHNLSLRYQQFKTALNNGNRERLKQSQLLIQEINSHRHILDDYEKLKHPPSIKCRVTHHDTKISNVLFDESDKGLCVIDLDTVMPGYFISDLGDMMRTYLSPADEEEKDFTRIDVRDEFFRAIIRGYVKELGEELNEEEQKLIFFSGMFLTYMQAMRFLTDHLNNDIYYGAGYENQNLVRAGNQVRLLKKLEEKKSILQKIINEELSTGKCFTFL